MKIFLITDIHHGENTNYERVGGLDYVNSFGNAFVSEIDVLQPIMESCDLVVNLGDLIFNKSSEDDLQWFSEGLSMMKTRAPVKHVPGNHDLFNIDRTTWAELVNESYSYYDFDMNGYHHIILDANRFEKGVAPYLILENQMQWLSDSLKNTNFPTIIYIHHPLDEQSMENNYYFRERPERSCVSNRKEVRQVLEDSGKVVAVFSGHTHFFHEQMINNIQYITVPSFAENNGNHEPVQTYAIADFSSSKIQIEILKL